VRKRREQATNSSLPENIRVHDDADRERTRLEHSAGALERLRTQELITRYVRRSQLSWWMSVEAPVLTPSG